MKKIFDPYVFLTHAMLHCRFGSTTEDRTPDIGDLLAEALLLELRKKLLD